MNQPQRRYTRPARLNRSGLQNAVISLRDWRKDLHKELQSVRTGSRNVRSQQDINADFNYITQELKHLYENALFENYTVDLHYLTVADAEVCLPLALEKMRQNAAAEERRTLRIDVHIIIGRNGGKSTLHPWVEKYLKSLKIACHPRNLNGAFDVKLPRRQRRG